MTWFAGTEHETRTCPRRHLIDNPDVGGALALWRACDGKPGIAALREMSSHTADAFAVIDSGRAARIESDERERQNNREAMAVADRGRR